MIVEKSMCAFSLPSGNTMREGGPGGPGGPGGGGGRY